MIFYKKTVNRTLIIYIFSWLGLIFPDIVHSNNNPLTSSELTNSNKEIKIIKYYEKGDDIQKLIDDSPDGSLIIFDPNNQIEVNSSILIRNSITLKGLNAKLPKGLSRVPIIIVEKQDVTITDAELHGNYDSVDQNDRVPLIRVHMGNFRINRCKFYHSSKDGVEVIPKQPFFDFISQFDFIYRYIRNSQKLITALNFAFGYKDIIGGVIKDIEAFEIGRDAVSLTGGNMGLKVRNITVENIRLKKSHFRGAVEVSDGSDNITVSNVLAESSIYAIDVQDHGKGSAPNTNIFIENVKALQCKHIIRTSNNNFGHANLTLRNLTGTNCEKPVRISNTKNVFIDGLKIIRQRGNFPPIVFKNCHGVTLKNLAIEDSEFSGQPVQLQESTEVKLE